MSQTKELSYSLEDLRCASCKNYLSCAPILVLGDGNSICGNCSPLHANEATQRVLALEAILSKLSFPCRFTHHGCNQELLFGQASQHEAECSYRSFNCPFSSNNCVWEGSVLQVYNHFAEAHPDAVVEKVEFELNINQDKEDILTLEVDDVRFFMKYMYCLETNHLLYEVKYVPFNVERVSSKIVLTNDVEEGYSITLKGNDCLPYDGHFLNLQNPDGLFLNNLLPVLNKPDRILIKMDLLVQKDQASREAQSLIVNYALLEKLRCKECREYLTPPVYKIEGTAGFVCCTCKKPGYVLLENNTMLQRWICQANYPCRWHDCKHVGKADNIRKHEQKLCRYRMHRCHVSNCKEMFRSEAALAHLLGHGLQHFDDVLVYKFVFSQTHGHEWFFSQKCNEIIFVRYSTKLYDSMEKKEFKHKIVVGESPQCKSEIKAVVQFEHAHCKIKSQKFSVSKGVAFRLNHMPSCFQIGDEVTVTLRLRCYCALCC